MVRGVLCCGVGIKLRTGPTRQATAHYAVSYLEWGGGGDPTQRARSEWACATLDGPWIGFIRWQSSAKTRDKPRHSTTNFSATAALSCLSSPASEAEGLEGLGKGEQQRVGYDALLPIWKVISK